MKQLMKRVCPHQVKKLVINHFCLKRRFVCEIPWKDMDSQVVSGEVPEKMRVEGGNLEILRTDLRQSEA